MVHLKCHSPLSPPSSHYFLQQAFLGFHKFSTRSKVSVKMDSDIFCQLISCFCGGVAVLEFPTLPSSVTSFLPPVFPFLEIIILLYNVPATKNMYEVKQGHG